MLRRNFLKGVFLFFYALFFGTTVKRENRIVTSIKDKEKLPTVYVDSFGAMGDGVTNDTLAFQQASEIINQAGGGTLVLSNKTYVVGKQSFAGTNTKGYSYKPEDIVYIHDCIKPVVIEGNGAILRADRNLKFGSFDPITGEIYNPKMPFTNLNYRADAYSMLQLNNNEMVTIKNLELDGNIENISLGGEWGDVGYQCRATGARLFSNKNLTIENVNSHHHALDGINIWYSLTESDEKKPHILMNVVSEYNARQGLSWTGGIGLTAINCKFNHTGKARFSSNPGAGVDIEADRTICREGFFLNCEMVNNTGSGVISYSGDAGYMTFKTCTIWGNTGAAVSPNKPGIVFEDCKIYGRITNVFGSDDPLEATKFIRCRIEDKNHPVYGIDIASYLIDINANNVLFDSCTLINNYQKLVSTSGSTTTEIFRKCKFIFKYDKLADKSSQAVFYGSRFENVTFSDQYNTPPATGYFIDIPGNTVQVVGDVFVNTSHTNWMSWSTGARGMKGNIGSQVNKPQKFISIHKRLENTPYYGQVLIGASNAAPTSGIWGKGDIVYNESPKAGGVIGWTCVTAGVVNNVSWVSGTAYTMGNLVNSNGKVYKCMIGGTSGAIPPSHTAGIATSGDLIAWEYVNTLAVFKGFGLIEL